MDIYIVSSWGHYYRYHHSKFSGYKGGSDEPGKEFENGVEVRDRMSEVSLKALTSDLLIPGTLLRISDLQPLISPINHSSVANRNTSALTQGRN